MFVSFLMVEHVHDHNDASFGHWSMKLPKEDFPTIPLLMKLYMDLDIVPIIPHLIEEVPDFIKPFILKGGNHLVVPFQTSTISLLCAWQCYTSHAIPNFVYFTEFGPRRWITCLAPRWIWKICVTRWRAKALHVQPYEEWTANHLGYIGIRWILDKVVWRYTKVVWDIWVLCRPCWQSSNFVILWGCWLS